MTTTACANHPDRAASVVCGHCDRPICTECMLAAPVGWQCPDCTAAGVPSASLRPKFNAPTWSAIDITRPM